MRRSFAQMDPPEKLAHLSRWLSNIWGSDAVFTVMQFGTLFAAELVKAKGGEAKANERLASILSDVGNSVNTGRFCIRFWGMIDSAHGLLVNPHKKGTVEHSIHFAQNATNLVYFPLEHLFWLGWRAPASLSPAFTDRMARWSSIAWATWIVLEVFRLRRAEARLRKALRTTEKKKLEDRARIAFALSQNRHSQFKQCCYFLQAVEWSVSGGIGLPPWLVNLLGLVGALAGLKVSFRASLDQ